MNIENREDKQVLTYEKEVEPGRLMTELYESLPELAPVFNDNGFNVNLRVFTNGSKLILWVPERTSADLVSQVVEAHQLVIKEEEGVL